MRDPGEGKVGWGAQGRLGWDGGPRGGQDGMGDLQRCQNGVGDP